MGAGEVEEQAGVAGSRLGRSPPGDGGLLAAPGASEERRALGPEVGVARPLERGLERLQGRVDAPRRRLGPRQPQARQVGRPVAGDGRPERLASGLDLAERQEGAAHPVVRRRRPVVARERLAQGLARAGRVAGLEARDPQPGPGARVVRRARAGLSERRDRARRLAQVDEHAPEAHARRGSGVERGEGLERGDGLGRAAGGDERLGQPEERVRGAGVLARGGRERGHGGGRVAPREAGPAQVDADQHVVVAGLRGAEERVLGGGVAPGLERGAAEPEERHAAPRRVLARGLLVEAAGRVEVARAQGAMPALEGADGLLRGGGRGEERGQEEGAERAHRSTTRRSTWARRRSSPASSATRRA
ncbi:MAG: hypothetical protein M9894_31170 [Planctomycetes bacterium]|nr:hypothetical protein [Planctomycetota bacterium]